MNPQREPLGWPLLPLPTLAGNLEYAPSLDADVRRAIQVILSTRPGELLTHPDFGVGLDLYRYELSTSSVRRELRDAISTQLTRWESRIDLDRVDVDSDARDAARLRITIVYRLKRTGASGQLGVTLTGNA